MEATIEAEGVGQLGDSLEEHKQRFEQWRGERKQGERIPTVMWTAAVKEARTRSVYRVARALRLDYAMPHQGASSARQALSRPFGLLTMPSCGFAPPAVRRAEFRTGRAASATCATARRTAADGGSEFVGLSSKLFLISADNTLHALADAAFMRMLRREAVSRIPDFAGQRVRQASVVTEVVGGHADASGALHLRHTRNQRRRFARCRALEPPAISPRE